MTVAMLGLSIGWLDLGPSLDSLPPIEKARTRIAETNTGLPLDAWQHFEDEDGIEVSIESALLFNIKPLQGIPIVRLRLIGVRVSNLGPLADSDVLLELECSDDPLLQSIEPLRGLANLQSLNIAGTVVTDLSPLMDCPKLERLEADEEVLLECEFLKQHPNAERLRLNSLAMDQFFGSP